jgi:hypothetical protein
MSKVSSPAWAGRPFAKVVWLDALSVVSRADAIGAILQHAYIVDLLKVHELPPIDIEPRRGNNS